MNGLTILLISVAAVLAGYLLYGRYLAKKWGIDPSRKTPAVEFEDGKDYVPNQPIVVFGHHFTSIAGAGPINGPILAVMFGFGWLPVLLWILLGGIFFGAVHDFAAMLASVRNKGKTIGYVIELAIGKTGKKLFLLFVWLFAVLVVAAFTDIVATTFDGFAADGSRLVASGSAATTSMVFIGVAVLFGLYMKYRKPKALECSFIAIGLLVLCVVIGLAAPMFLGRIGWIYVILLYAYLASVAPVWALLTPRDFINTFLLIIIMLAGFLGIIIARPDVNVAAFAGFTGIHFSTGAGRPLFPILFVTIACGAISGFHALVASGTVSKQISSERHLLPVGYGAMMVECLLAVISLITVSAILVGGTLPAGVSTPFDIFSYAISSFLAVFNLPTEAVRGFFILGLSAFALTSLDTCARIARMAVQEFFTEDGKELSPLAKVITNRWVATGLTVLFSFALAMIGYQNIWALFGSANQLLAALGLIACAVFLKKIKKKGSMLYFPMFFMLAATLTSLTMHLTGNFQNIMAGNFVFNRDFLQIFFGTLLMVLGVVVAFQGVKKLKGKDSEAEAAA